MVKTVAPAHLQGITLTDGAVRSTHGVTIAAYRTTHGDCRDAG